MGYRRRARSLRKRYGRTSRPTGGFRKVWFSKGSEKTAGLILPATKLAGMSISEISRLFPVSEARKMGRLHTSPTFATWEEAFRYPSGGE
jgi:hypothetical protein